MATRKGNWLPSNFVADRISVDSLSFQDLVSIQDQQPKPPAPPNKAKHSKKVSQQDPEFEFASNFKAELNSAAAAPVANPFKITPADMLISNGQIQPQALSFDQPINGSFITNPPLSSLLATHSSGKMPGEQARNHKDTESAVTRKGFGQKMFSSFLAACRECKAIKPGAVKRQPVPAKKFKVS